MRLLLVIFMVVQCSRCANSFMHQFPKTLTASSETQCKRVLPLAQARGPYEAGPSRVEHVRTALTTILGKQALRVGLHVSMHLKLYPPGTLVTVFARWCF